MATCIRARSWRPEDTRVIDPEFGFYGPMGFDVGAYLANLLLAYFSQVGHEKTPGERDAYRARGFSRLSNRAGRCSR